jgi:hypothetical protein
MSLRLRGLKNIRAGPVEYLSPALWKTTDGNISQ